MKPSNKPSIGHAFIQGGNILPRTLTKGGNIPTHRPLSGNDDTCKDNGRGDDGDQFLAHLVSIDFLF